MDSRRRFLSIAEAASRLGLARITAYRMAADGRLPSVKLGSRRLVPIAALEAIEAEALAAAGEGV